MQLQLTDSLQMANAAKRLRDEVWFIVAVQPDSRVTYLTGSGLMEDAHEIFVPGRVCLMGEHSDWVSSQVAASTSKSSGVVGWRLPQAESIAIHRQDIGVRNQ